MRRNMKRPEKMKAKAYRNVISDSLDEAIRKHSEKEKRKYPVRINRQTIIFAARKKLPKGYEQWCSFRKGI